MQAYHTNWLVVALVLFLFVCLFFCQSKRFEQTFYNNLNYLGRIFMAVFKLTNIVFCLLVCLFHF